MQPCLFPATAQSYLGRWAFGRGTQLITQTRKWYPRRSALRRPTALAIATWPWGRRRGQSSWRHRQSPCGCHRHCRKPRRRRRHRRYGRRWLRCHLRRQWNPRSHRRRRRCLDLLIRVHLLRELRPWASRGTLPQLRRRSADAAPADG